MLVFLIPLKSRTVSNSWERVCLLLERTLRSICAQSVSEFRVIVVCNEKPDITFCHPNLEFLFVDIIPNNTISSGLNKEREDDKARRIMSGMVKAREYQPSFVMVVDADDCVSKDLAAYVQAHKDGRGWYLASGYVHPQGKRWMFKKQDGFQKICGTCLILKPDDVEKLIALDNLLFCFKHATPPSESIPLDPLPFIGAVYSVRNSENHHMTQTRLANIRIGQPGLRVKTAIRRLGNYRLMLLTSAKRKQFGLYPIK